MSSPPARDSAPGCDDILIDTGQREFHCDHWTLVSDKTMYKHANSWYLGANIPGKPRVFMPHMAGFNG
jgi:cyclohexanone monooxygenase